MNERNPRLAPFTPSEALALLKIQTRAYMEKKSPFNRKKKPGQSARDWWKKLLTSDYDDVSIIGVCTVYQSFCQMLS